MSEAETAQMDDGSEEKKSVIGMLWSEEILQKRIVKYQYTEKRERDQ